MLVRVECVIRGLRFFTDCFVAGAAGTVGDLCCAVLCGLGDACQQAVHAVILAGVSVGGRLYRLLCLLRQRLYQRGHGVQDSIQLGINTVACGLFCRCRRDTVLCGGSFGHRGCASFAGSASGADAGAASGAAVTTAAGFFSDSFIAVPFSAGAAALS